MIDAGAFDAGAFDAGALLAVWVAVPYVAWAVCVAVSKWRARKKKPAEHVPVWKNWA